MPKRIIDGEALWLSDKLLRLPVRFRAEFANLIPLASATGSFEASPEKVWRTVYGYNRPDITAKKVAEILDALESAKMLFRWQDAAGKVWGFWVGIDKPGRLPSRSQVERKNVTCGPEPPRERLNAFLENSAECSEPTDSRCQVNDMSLTSESHVNDNLGSGSGLGSGSSDFKEQNPQKRSGNNSPDAPSPSRFAFTGQVLKITDMQDKALGDAFPWVDRPKEYAKMDSWLVGNPERRVKQFSGFAHNWFSKIPSPATARATDNAAKGPGYHGGTRLF